MQVKEESEKAGLNIQKTEIMTSSPIISQEVEEEKMETVKDLIFLDSKMTADRDGSHEIKKCLLLGRKAMTNLDNIIKIQRHRFVDEGLYSQSYGFSSSHVWM